MPESNTPKALTKTQLKTQIAAKVGLTAKQVDDVVNELLTTLQNELATTGAFTLPGVLKLTKIIKPAVKGGVQKPNPFKKGEMITTKDKPEKAIIRVRVMKNLKDSIQNNTAKS